MEELEVCGSGSGLVKPPPSSSGLNFLQIFLSKIIWITLTESSTMTFFPFSEVQFSYSFVLINNPLRAKALVNHLFLSARKIIWGTLYLLLYCQRNYTQEMKKQGKTDCLFCKSIGESLFGFFFLMACIRFCLSSPCKKSTKNTRSRWPNGSLQQTHLL